MINKIINLWKRFEKKRIDKGGFYKKIIFMGFLKGNEKIATEGIYRLGKRIPRQSLKSNHFLLNQDAWLAYFTTYKCDSLSLTAPSSGIKLILSLPLTNLPVCSCK